MTRLARKPFRLGVVAHDGECDLVLAVLDLADIVLGWGPVDTWFTPKFHDGAAALALPSHTVTIYQAGTVDRTVLVGVDIHDRGVVWVDLPAPNTKGSRVRPDDRITYTDVILHLHGARSEL